MRRLLVLLIVCSAVGSAQSVKQNSGTDASLRGVKAVSEKICWASGTGGTVLLTTDGGEHWNVMHVSGAEKLDFRDVEAWDAKTAIVMSSGPAEQGAAKIFKTSDGGAHWREVFSTDRKGIFLDALAFWDNKHGIGLSDPVDGKFVLIATEDGGDSWHLLAPKKMPDALSGEGGFAASGTTIAVAGKHDAWFGTGGAKVARVFHSRDDGKTWVAVETPIPAGKASAGIFSMFVAKIKPRSGWSLFAGGGDYQAPDVVGDNVARSMDAGKTWTKFKRTGYVSAIGNAYLLPFSYVGSSGDWTMGPPNERLALNSVSFTSSNGLRSFAVGAKGIIVRTTLHAKLETYVTAK